MRRTNCELTNLSFVAGAYVPGYNYINKDGIELHDSTYGYRYYACDVSPSLYFVGDDGQESGPYENRNWVPFEKDGTPVCRVTLDPGAEAERQSELGSGDCQTRPNAGNPINVGLGNKYQEVVDILPTGASSLRWSRFYNSGAVLDGDDANDPGKRIDPTLARLGSQWRGTYDRSIMQIDGARHVRLFRHTGERIDFIEENGRYRSTVDPRGMLVREGATWRYDGKDGDIERYDASGRLTDLNPGTSQHIRLRYSDALIEATDLQGRALAFTYDPLGRITDIRDGSGVAVSFTYANDSDRTADLLAATYADGTSHRYLYNERPYVTSDLPHALTGIVDETGKRFASFYFDASGRAMRSEHADGVGRTSLQRDVDGTVKVTGPMGAVHAFRYAEVRGVRRLVGVDQPGGSGCGAAFSRLEYEADGTLKRAVNFDGMATEYTHDSEGRETNRIEAAGTSVARAVRTEWAANFVLPTKITLPGREERFTYDDAGNLTRRELWAAIDPTAKDAPLTLSRVWKFTYDAEGRLLQEEGPRSDASGVAVLQRYTYRPSTASSCGSGSACDYRKGDLWTIENAAGHKGEILRFDASGRILAERSATGALVENEYTKRGWLLSRKETRTDGTVAITSMTYNERGDVTSITDADGVTLTFDYDAAGRLIMVANPSNHRLMFELDKAGNRIRETGYDSFFLKTQLKRTFDALGRLETEQGEDAGMSTFTYDEVGRPTGMKDGDGRRSSSSYDALGRLREAIGDLDGKQARIEATHDPLDQVTSVVDPDAVTTRYLTTGMGDLANVESPDGGSAFDEYDAAGLLSRHEGPGDIGSFRVTRDALGRPLTMSYSDPKDDTTYVYDSPDATCPGDRRNGTGQLTAMTTLRGTTLFCHDAAGNVALRIQRWGTTAKTASYTYTKAGRLASMGVDGGATAVYRYDIDGKVNGVKVEQAGISTDLITKVAYRPFDNIESWTYGNDYTFSNSRDKAGRITAWGGLDPNGSNYWVDPSPGGDIRADVTRGYAYAFNHNGLGYLDEVRDYNTGSNLVSFDYNASGDRLALRGGGLTDSYVYQPGTHRLTMADGKARRYDDAGNLIALGDATLAYDGAARLASASEQGRTVVSYGYDGEGNRVARTVGTNGKTTLTLFDEAGRWLADYDDTGKVSKQAVRMNELLVGLVADGKLYYVAPDHLGSPREILDPVRNAIVWRWWHNRDPFGSMLPDEDPDGDGTAFNFNLRFPGQRYDPLTGLHANGARDYDPTTGRYVQADPIGLAGGVNPYAYVTNRPLSAVDPLGLVKWEGYVETKSISAILAISAFKFGLISECVGGRRAAVLLDAGGVGIGVGLKYSPPVAGTGSAVSFEDGMHHVDPNILNGWFSAWSAGAAVQHGYGVSMIQLGGVGRQFAKPVNAGARAKLSFGPQHGFDLSASGIAGRSEVTHVEWTQCGCANK
ncbi:RHS repeat-associated core domain-containing protein [Luteibacter yeojuensis]|uniref:RHS repeat-associated protein n=1 Tax=Luteibacter yeojuensis TaxID=345309 RepID=A0A0F3KZU1_9GAMM|nr:RHS repeat-associated core domain-containing protein [Luteibacter yeojuensis]KJV36805.1 hypothetical protein VI08_03360 [Luteibacter yeojuensis]